MTTEDFIKLSPAEQDIFLSNGGKLEKSMSSVVHAAKDDSKREESVSSTSVEGLLSPPDDQQTPPSPSSYSEYYDGFDIKDPLELLYLLDDDVAQGHITLHGWQVEFLTDFGQHDWTDQNPFQAIVRACNGSGKDKYIIAPCVVWLCMRYRLARGIVTSASGVQLDNQTDSYIRQLCENANKKYAGGRQEIWKINYRYYECLPTQSPIILFATDEPGKAEGYHPLGWARKMALFESEGKTVPDEIFLAQSRCTGFTHRVIVSTPGLPMGHFFDIDSTAVSRSELKSIIDRAPTDFVKWVITYKECKHISENYAKQMANTIPGGKNSPVWKSMFLAEFGTTDDMVVIPYTYVWQSYTFTPQRTQPKWIQEPYNKAGLDLSDGGDETVLTVRNGNKHLKTIPFRFDNTEDTVTFLNDQFRENNLNHPEAFIFADCGGLGKPILDRLKRMGWSNIKYVDNRSKPLRPKTYINRGTEMWFNVRVLFERRELIVVRDEKLVRQLSTRYYKINANNVHQLMSKIEARSHGYPSPDRADSFVLAFADYKSVFKESVPEKDSDRPFSSGKMVEKHVGSFTQQHLLGGKKDNLKKHIPKRGDMTIYQSQIDNYNRRLKVAVETTQLPN